MHTVCCSPLFKTFELKFITFNIAFSTSVSKGILFNESFQNKVSNKITFTLQKVNTFDFNQFRQIIDSYCPFSKLLNRMIIYNKSTK